MRTRFNVDNAKKVTLDAIQAYLSTHSLLSEQERLRVEKLDQALKNSIIIQHMPAMLAIYLVLFEELNDDIFGSHVANAWLDSKSDIFHSNLLSQSTQDDKLKKVRDLLNQIIDQEYKIEKRFITQAAQQFKKSENFEPQFFKKAISEIIELVELTTNDELILLYRFAAEQGNAHAQYELALCYENGRGVEKDVKEAVCLYRLAAEQNNLDAQYNLATCYANGYAVAKDEKEAFDVYYAAAMDTGHVQAQYNLAVCFAKGRGVTKNEKAAISHYQMAAQQGYAQAQYELAICYANGYGVTKDEKEAARLYGLAAEQGHASAQCNLGFCYSNGCGVTKNKKEAACLYGLAAEQGNAIAQYNLGCCYENGWGVTEDEKEAAHLYDLAAKQGNASAQCTLGICYANGYGVTKNEKEAARLYGLAAEQGNAIAQFRLGFCYANGHGVTKDEKEAARLYDLAAKQGHAIAQCNLGSFYAEGRGVTQDEKEEVRLYGLAAEQGYASAQFNLAVCYANGCGVTKDEKEAARLYGLAAEQGYASAQFNLGIFYAEGRGVTIDEKETARLYGLAAEQGNASAQYELALCYENGHGVIKDAKEAVRLYGLAAKQGNVSAQSHLGWMNLTGRGVEKKDEKEAARFFQCVAQQIQTKNGPVSLSDIKKLIDSEDCFIPDVWPLPMIQKGYCCGLYALNIAVTYGFADEFADDSKTIPPARKEGDKEAKTSMRAIAKQENDTSFGEIFNVHTFKKLTDYFKISDDCKVVKVKGYDLDLMSKLLNDSTKTIDTSKIAARKIYLSSEEGTYIVRDSKGEVQTGSLKESDIDLSDLPNRLSNKGLKESILKVTSEAGHTQKNPGKDEYIKIICDQLKSGHTLITACDLQENSYFPGCSQGYRAHWATIFGYYYSKGKCYFLITQHGEYYAWDADALYQSNLALPEDKPWVKEQYVYYKTTSAIGQGKKVHLVPPTATIPNGVVKRFAKSPTLKFFQFGLFAVPRPSKSASVGEKCLSGISVT